MSSNTAPLSRLLSRPIGKYSYLSQPLGVGLFAILIITAAILFFGDSQVERSVVRNAGSEHERDLLRFSETLHHSGLDLSSSEVREDPFALTATSAFDAAVKRSLFGLRAERMDIYSLDGVALYSTEGLQNTAALSGSAQEALDAARGGQFTSFLRGTSSSREDLGVGAETLQSFAVLFNVAPGSGIAGHPVMVASITTDVADELTAGYATLWLVVGLFFFGSLTILAVVHWASVRSRARLQEANDALAEQYVAVRDSRERMIAAADATKKAIAEELHGSVQTRLFSLWTRLNGVVPGPEGQIDRPELAAIADELDELRENDIRGLSHRLHPSIVRVGAAPALRSLCDRLSGEVEVNLNVGASAAELEPPGASPIPERVRLAVFRIAELAIGNTIKHASAKSCNVSWSYSSTRQQLLLVVKDDGVGFDPDALTTAEFGGLGIVNIQDYTDAIGGTAVLRSEPGRGTVLTVTVPFEPVETETQAAKPNSRPERPSNITPFDQQKAA